MVKILSWIAFVTGFGAAIFWLWSAIIPIPKIDLHWNEEAPLFVGALTKQSELSAVAAVCTAVSVFAQAVTGLLGQKKSK
jgi:hypothetical protein